MKGKVLCTSSLLCVLSLTAPFVLAEPAKDAKSGAASNQPEMKLPPGWTPDDMKACMDAAAPGKMHQYLASAVGTWHGKNKMWMAPDTDPMNSEGVSTFTPMMDGRFVKCEMSGEMPGMGPFNGFAIYGFDNVSQKFQCTWVDNMGTGMMTGTGELSSDGKTLTWSFNYNCPVTKKPITMREIETMTGPNSKTVEMFGIEPKSGKEFKMMEMAMTRKGDAGGSAEMPARK